MSVGRSPFGESGEELPRDPRALLPEGGILGRYGSYGRTGVRDDDRPALNGSVPEHDFADEEHDGNEQEHSTEIHVMPLSLIWIAISRPISNLGLSLRVL